MTWGKDKAFRYHRICPWTSRYVRTLGGVTQSSLRPGQWLPLVLALSRSDWDNYLSMCKPGGVQSLPSWWCAWDKILCLGQNPVRAKLSGFNFHPPIKWMLLELLLHHLLKLFALGSQNGHCDLFQLGKMLMYFLIDIYSCFVVFGFFFFLIIKSINT